MNNDAETYAAYGIADSVDPGPLSLRSGSDVNAGVILIFALAAGGGLCALLMAFVGR